MDNGLFHIRYTLPLWTSPKRDHTNTGATSNLRFHTDAPMTTLSQPPGDRKDGSGPARVAARLSCSRGPLASPGRMFATRSSRRGLVDMHGCLRVRILFIDRYSDEDPGEIVGVPLLVHIDFGRGGPRPRVHRLCARGVLEHRINLTELPLIYPGYLSDRGRGGGPGAVRVPTVNFVADSGGPILDFPHGWTLRVQAVIVRPHGHVDYIHVPGVKGKPFSSTVSQGESCRPNDVGV